jgi:hypothetical protein
LLLQGGKQQSFEYQLDNDNSSCSSSRLLGSLAGGLVFYMVQSQFPNQIGIVTFVDLPKGLELYLTDNAWNGEAFQTNEGTMKVSTVVC